VKIFTEQFDKFEPDEGILEPGGALSRTVRNLAAPRPLTVSAPSIFFALL
jgi:hypothetical protein